MERRKKNKAGVKSWVERTKAAISKEPRTSRTVHVGVIDQQTGKTKRVPVTIHTGGKFPVSTRAIIQRINRVLAKNGSDEQLKTARGWRYLQNCGQYYTINLHYNCIARHDVSPKDLARELGVLKPYEEVKD